MTVEDRWVQLKGRPAGFDYMRIALAVSVLLWHGYGLSYSGEAALAFWEISPLSWLLVLILPVFFALSGFLVSGSMYRSPSLKVFLGLRFIRIFPALVVETLLSAFLLGPIVTVLSLGQYFSGGEFYRYMLNIVGWIHYELPGVFLNNPFPNRVNGSLWTVPFELECYALISALALVGMFRRRRLVIPLFVLATIIVAIDLYIEQQPASPPGFVNGRVLVLCFFAGIVTYAFRERLRWSVELGIGALALASLLFHLHHGAAFLAPLFVGYGTVCLGLTDPKRTIVVESGDYSYGTYLYAFPIQQTVSWMLGPRANWALNVGIALPITISFALFSWWCVEKPFLKVRRFLHARPAPTPARAGEAAPC